MKKVKKTMQEWGKLGGEATSEKKAKASRENGKKGGRPRQRPNQMIFYPNPKVEKWLRLLPDKTRTKEINLALEWWMERDKKKDLETRMEELESMMSLYFQPMGGV